MSHLHLSFIIVGIAALLALGIVALLAGWLRNRSLRRKMERGEISEMPGIRKSRPDGCCGKHAACEKEALLKAAAKCEVVYYDDEELDVYRGKSSDAYSPQEVEDFEEVLSTMLEDDVPGWLRSLQLRGINLPDELKDEVLIYLS